MKKIALLLAAVMVAAMVPVSAFAASTNRVTNVATMKAGDKTTAYNTPSIVLEEKDAWTSGDQFELVLDGATWAITDIEVGENFKVTKTVEATPVAEGEEGEEGDEGTTSELLLSHDVSVHGHDEQGQDGVDDGVGDGDLITIDNLSTGLHQLAVSHGAPGGGPEGIAVVGDRIGAGEGDDDQQEQGSETYDSDDGEENSDDCIPAGRYRIKAVCLFHFRYSSFL